MHDDFDEALLALVVEDDEDYAEVVMGMLARNPELTIKVEHARSMADAQRVLEARGQDVDLVLLDLHLPDESGLRTIKAIQSTGATCAIVVMTAMREQQLAFEAIKLGAQEYVVKDDITPQLLLRTVRYAVERRQLIERLKAAERASERERELRKLERLSGPTDHSSVTAGIYGDASVRTHLAERYQEAVEEYVRLLDEALEERAYKTGASVNEDLRSLAAVLGVLRASPRDVIELHTAAMTRAMVAALPERTQGYVEEGRIMVLELMGYLAAYYRVRAVGPARAPGTERDKERA